MAKKKQSKIKKVLKVAAYGTLLAGGVIGGATAQMKRGARVLRSAK
mgnify:CR=1 FL=1